MGNEADAERRLPARRHDRGGILEAAVTRPATSRSSVETNTDNWDPDQRPEQHGAAPDGQQTTRSTPSSPRTTAWPPAWSRRSTAQGLAGKVPVSGQDGDTAALNRVALGTQTVAVWKNARALGKTAGEAAVAALQRHEDADVKAPSICRRRGPAPQRTVPTPRQHAQLDPAHPDADHQGQPQGRRRRRLDRPRTGSAPGRDRRHGAGRLRLTIADSSRSKRPAPADHRGAGRFHPVRARRRRDD